MSSSDNLVEPIREFVERLGQLARQAKRNYSIEIDALIRDQSRDKQRIERLLEGILDFCFDEKVLALYKKLCRYYFQIDAEATASYIFAYRDMWDNEHGSEEYGIEE